MEQKRNLIGHFESSASNSDKIYMACVRDNEDGTWTVIGKYGRRGRKFQQQVKLTTRSESIAHQEQRDLFASKAKKGYLDIDSPSYSGPVSRSEMSVSQNLEKESTAPARKPRKPVPEPEPTQEFEDELVCVDNSGMEESFDVGVTFVVEPHKDPSMIYAYDRYGEKQECLCERFVSEKKYAKMAKARV